MTSPKITTAQSLFVALEGRGRQAQARESFDAGIWDSVGAEGAILVTDLSGFTRLTKAHGILHFLSLFRRFQKACAPVITKHGGSLMKQEADDLIGVFDRAEDAVGSALEMLRICRGLNEGEPPEERLGLCAGVEYGRFLKLDDDAFGDPVNVAYKLGEDLADPDEVLVGPKAFEAVSNGGLDLTTCEVSPGRTVEIGGTELSYHSLSPAR